MPLVGEHLLKMRQFESELERINHLAVQDPQIEAYQLMRLQTQILLEIYRLA